MTTTEELLAQGDAARNQQLELISQFFQSPTRMEEARQLVDAQADQSFNALTGQFRRATTATGQAAARRGLQGSSVALGQQEALRGALQRGTAQVEAQRQANLAQAQQALQAMQLAAQQRAYQPDPFQQQSLGALNAAVGGQVQAAQQRGQFLQQQQALNSALSSDLGASTASPVNLLAEIFRNQGAQ